MRKLRILLLALVMVVGTVGCGAETKDKEPTKKEVVKKEEDVKEETARKEDDSNSTDETVENATASLEDNNVNQDLASNENDSTTSKKESTTNKNKIGTTNNTTTNPSEDSTAKPGDSGSNNSGSSGDSNNSSNNSGNTTPSESVHTHTWVEFEKEMPNTRIWYERVGAWRTLCGRCQLDMTDMTDDELVWHVTVECNSRYYTTFVETGEPIRHEETEIETYVFVRCTECGFEEMKAVLEQ